MEKKEIKAKVKPKMVSVIPPDPDYPTDVIVPPITLTFDDVPVKKEKQYLILSPNDARGHLCRYLRHWNIPFRYYRKAEAIEELSNIIKFPTYAEIKDYDHPCRITHGCEPGQSYPMCATPNFCVLETYLDPIALYKKIHEIYDCDEYKQRQAWIDDVQTRRDQDMMGFDFAQISKEQDEQTAIGQAEAADQGITYHEYLRNYYKECDKKYGKGQYRDAVI